MRQNPALFAAALVSSLLFMSALSPAHAQRLTPAQEKSMEDWTYAQAIFAATYGAPAVMMYCMRADLALGPKPKAAPNSIWRLEDITTPRLAAEAGYVTPNVNTIYGFGFLDLGPEPIILTVPDSGGRYYVVEIVNMWTDAFAYAGGVETGYKGGKFALVGPGFKGSLPDGVTRIDSATRWVLIQPRVHVVDEADLPRARKVLQGIEVQGLAHFTGQSAPEAPTYRYLQPNTKAGESASALAFQDPLQFWEILAAVMNENPPPADQVTAVLPSFKALGIELGKPWDRSNVNPVVLQAMTRAAADVAPMLKDLPFGRLDNGWFVPPPDTGMSGADYRTRAVVSRIGLTSNTNKETIYSITTVDGDGQPLTGAKRYTLTFKETLPFIAPGFWSITMYDTATTYTVPNSINRYFLGSDTKLKANQDGSVTMYIQTDSPGADKESNWLPAPPGPFYLAPRVYPPGPAMIDWSSNPKAFSMPPVVETR